MVKEKPLLPFIAYSLSLFFSLTRYTLPTSPLPSILIFEKLDGPTSTLDGWYKTKVAGQSYYVLPAVL